MAALAKLPGLTVCGTNANMLLLEVQQPIATIVDGLAARGLLVADAACFGGLGSHRAIRVSLRARNENDRLLQALQELA